MQQTRAVEVGTGLFVLLGIGALFFLTTQTTGGDSFSAKETFEVQARFENVGSLKSRAPVSMSGVTIGRIKDVHFDAESLEAVVTFVIDSQYDKIPDDSDASILTAGLLGSQYTVVKEEKQGRLLTDRGGIQNEPLTVEGWSGRWSEPGDNLLSGDSELLLRRLKNSP